MEQGAFKIQLPIFEGPFDLLLFFIERDELDIYDIPISKITNDFLDYLHAMQELNIEVAAEFILIAASLMRIKAKMLIPRKEVNEAGEVIDPRKNLVEQLLTYKQYKTMVGPLMQLELKRSAMHKRGNQNAELIAFKTQFSTYEELAQVDLFKLLSAYHRALARFSQQNMVAKHVVESYSFSIESQKTIILTTLNIENQLNFEALVHLCKIKMEFIFTFLALLELIQLQMVQIQIGDDFNQFWIKKAS